jgi:1,4-alpha-glucan branching enzyme
MSVLKKTLKTKKITKLIFEVKKEESGFSDQSFLISEFNNWEPLEMKKLKSGKNKDGFKIEINVPFNKKDLEYKFLFKNDNHSEFYDNDWNADSYRPNGVDGENSVVAL